MASNYTCYARIYLPLSETGKPLPDEDRYYDLAIDGDGETFKMDSYSKVGFPVFSYGNVNSVGMMRIFDASKTFRVFPEPALGCTYMFEANETAVKNFITTMRSCLTHIDGDAAVDNYALYRVDKGPFKTYSKEYVNPFFATAYMCNLLGDDTLLTEYNDNKDSATAYKNYCPWKMFEKYYKFWTFEALNL